MAASNKRLKMLVSIEMRIYILVTLISCVIAVDRGNFKTCDQSGFCKRQRATESGKSPFVILMDSIHMSQHSIQLQLLNSISQLRLSLELSAIEGNMVRLKINELNPEKPRFEVPVDMVMAGELKQDNLKIVNKNENSVEVMFQNNRIVLTSDPFRIDYIVDGEPLISFNARGLLKFEHMRTKKDENKDPNDDPVDDKAEDIDDPDDGDGNDDNDDDGREDRPDEDDKDEEEDNPDRPADEEPDMWEETFKSHTDSKPNGPTSMGIDISFPGFQHVYGLPEHADKHALRTTVSGDPYRLYNLDVFEYELDTTMALYGSVPLMYAHNEERTIGVFWLNSAEMWVDISSNVADKTYLSKLVDLVKANTDLPQTDTHWFSESGIIDIFFLLGPTPADVFKQYAMITGTTPLPPLFSIAYHQCRWNYNDEDDVKSVDDNFDKFDIPYDVIWLDIEHTNGKRYFTWDASRFPHSLEMINNLASKGRKLVNVVDPHLKRDDNYHIYSDAKSKGLMVKDKNGNEFEGWCWPGTSSWPDFLDPAMRAWWASKFEINTYEGTNENVYIWNDMNEPAVFNGPEVTMHKDAQHHGGWEHRDVHNLYGIAVHSATWDGLLKRSNYEKRPFVLTRSFFAGSQKYGSVWTGDNLADWQHLRMSIPMLLSLSIAGISFSGADVGGFFKNPDIELLTRWYQAAAYQPFFRAHAHLDTKRREPWLHDEQYMNIIRDAIQARYSLLPYWYTLFFENELTGMPPMRPLWVEFPKEKAVFEIETEHMLGSALLVRPVFEANSYDTDVYLPGGADQLWYDVDTFKSYHAYPGTSSITINTPLTKIPVLQKGGTIVPRKLRMRRSSALTYSDPFTFIVCLDRQGYAEGEVYVDDYQSFNYKKGEFIYRKLIYENNRLQSANIGDAGQFTTKAWVERVVIVGLDKAPTVVSITSTVLNAAQLEFTYDSSLKVLRIRKPAVNIGENWAITIQ